MPNSSFQDFQESPQSILHSFQSAKPCELTFPFERQKSEYSVNNGGSDFSREFRNWRACRLLLRLFGFILFDTALCALFIGLNSDGDYWTSGLAVVRMLELGFFAIGGGLIGGFVSWDVDLPVRRCSGLMQLEAIPLLAAAASTDFWDTFRGDETRKTAATTLATMVKERIEEGNHQQLYPYAKHLLQTMLKSRDVNFVKAIVSWVAIARPINGQRAVRRLEKSLWVRDNETLHKHAWRCLNLMIAAGGCEEPFLILVRGSEQPGNQYLLKTTSAHPLTKPDEMLRSADGERYFH